MKMTKQLNDVDVSIVPTDKERSCYEALASAASALGTTVNYILYGE